MKTLFLTLAAGILLTGCRIDPTPVEYIDTDELPADDVSAAEDEITDRLRSTAAALQRRSLNELLAALAPAEDVSGWGPDSAQVIANPTDLGFALTEMAAGRRVQMDDVEVHTGLRNTTAWFRALYQIEDGDENLNMRFSGVFIRSSGDWRLVQAHVSRPTAPSNPEVEPEDGTEEGA